jgi:hypothetical protein
LIVNQTGAQPVVEFQDDGAVVFRIIDGGNVGIGSSEPAYRLDVAGDARVSGMVYSGEHVVTGSINASGNLRTNYGHVQMDSPKCFAATGSGASIALASGSTVPLNSKTYDPNGNYLNTAGNYSYTVPVKGVYIVSYNVTGTVGSDALWYVQIAVNGTQRVDSRCVNNIMATVGNATCSATVVWQLNEGAVLKLVTNSATSITVNIVGSSFNAALLYAVP